VGVPTQVRELIGQGRLTQAAQLIEMLLQATPTDAALWRAAVRVAIARGQLPQALAASHRSNELEPLNAEGWALLGGLEQLVGRLDRAEKALQRALELAPDAIHMSKLAVVLRQLGRHSEALALLHQATALRPDLAAGWQQLGELELAQSRFEEAAAALMRARELAPERPATSHQLGLALLGLERLEEACDAFDAAFSRDSHLYAALARSVELKRRLARWDGLAQRSAALEQAVRTGIPGIPPQLMGFESDDPALQLQASRQQAEALLRALRKDYPDGLAHPPRPGRERPRVALLWLGHGARAFARQLIGLLAQMPTKRPALLLYVDDVLARRLPEQPLPGCDAVFVVSDWDHDRLAHQLIEQEVDILIDAGGWSANAAPQVAALRPAPLQICWLGHSGSSGAPWMDYLIGDLHVLPTTADRICSERWIRLPHCHLPADRTPPLSQPASRSALGLPREGFVYVNVGAREKIGPQVWNSWMEILREVPGSLLCMDTAAPFASADERLRQVAQAAGVAPERLCFVTLADEQMRLQLLRQADLYLDSWPAGARSSGSDALWAGLPLLTRNGRSFGSRVAGSQLCELGLDELVADSVDRYVDLAILIGRSPELHAELRGKLAARKAASPLFDQARFGRDFCSAIEQVWARHRSGEPPRDIEVRG
jgi:predicted O-linked N-acetylglucosamine transferase (SPINDLY family)